MQEIELSDLPPPAMAERAEALGEKKAKLNGLPQLLLAILGGVFVALGGCFSMTLQVGAQELPWGVARALAGLGFSLGLILIVIGGAELFTGNTVLVMAWASRRMTLRRVLGNWAVVYLGNFIGALATATCLLLSGQHEVADGQVGAVVVKLAAHKCHLAFTQAFFLGIFCNFMVCLAVWLSLSARTTGGKILAIVFPITAFVTAGFEHCVANMYTVPLALMIKNTAAPEAGGALAAALAGATHLDWGHFLLGNLVPVTLGNIVGGAALVWGSYWLIYRQNAGVTETAPAGSEPDKNGWTTAPAPRNNKLHTPAFRRPLQGVHK